MMSSPSTYKVGAKKRVQQLRRLEKKRAEQKNKKRNPENKDGTT